jgi:hypothetical protein
MRRPRKEAIVMTADMVMTFLAGLLLVALVGIPIVVWLLVLVAGVRRAAARIHDSYADARQTRRRHLESRAAVVAAAEILADVPDPVSPAPRHAAGRWTQTTPLDDQSAEVIAAMVAGAHPRPR